MEQNEILENNREGRRFPTEKKRSGRLEGEFFALFFLLGTGLLLLICSLLHNLPIGDILAMFWACCAGDRAYRLMKRKRLFDGVTLVISLFWLVYFLVKYMSLGR